MPILNIINAWGQGKETHKFVMKRIYLFLIQALMALSLVLAVGCSKDDNSGGGSIPGVNKPPTCTISNPQNNVQFNMDESISVTVVAEKEKISGKKRHGSYFSFGKTVE